MNALCEQPSEASIDAIDRAAMTLLLDLDRAGLLSLTGGEAHDGLPRLKRRAAQLVDLMRRRTGLSSPDVAEHAAEVVQELDLYGFFEPLPVEPSQQVAQARSSGRRLARQLRIRAHQEECGATRERQRAA